MDANELAKMAVEGAPFTCAVGPDGIGLILADARGNDVFDGDNESQALVKVMRVYNALAAQTRRAERAEKIVNGILLYANNNGWASIPGEIQMELIAARDAAKVGG